jgi:DNA-binding LytR/AlgR family response regulator
VSTGQLGALDGVDVLVVEDEFYLAAEVKELVERAGGGVVGPFAQVAAALAAMAAARPDCAIVDVNLGQGATFELADALVAQAIPFAFLTGYDASMLPARFEGTPRIEKPAELSAIVAELRRLASSGGA